MSEPSLKVNVYIENKGLINVPFTPGSAAGFGTTAEEVSIVLCKQLNIGTIARHLFALRVHGKQMFLAPSEKFTVKHLEYDFRIRFKPTNFQQLKKIDIKAYDYFFHQVRTDVFENKIPDLIYEKYRQEILGLGITDMYRVMLEKDISRETVENDYKKYIPKEVMRRHSFFVKKPIHETLGKIKKAGYDAWFVKAEYIKQVDIMAPEYLAEEYKAQTDRDGSILNIIIRVVPNDSDCNLKYCNEYKRDKWYPICTFEELMYVSLRNDGTVEISRKNGIPYYLKFNSLNYMYSFVSLLDGYYRLGVKWIFNICKEVQTQYLQKLYQMKCHGPVGGEFSYAKLETKRNNREGCFILRESEKKYDVYYIDLCIKDSSKPKTFKLEKVSSDKFIFNDDLRTYSNIHQLMAAYNDPEGNIHLAECLPPSEYDQSPLLLCRPSNSTGASLTDTSALDNVLLTTPLIISSKDLQVYKGQKTVGSSGVTTVYRGMWCVTKGKKIEVAMKTIKQDNQDDQYRNFLDLAGQWAFLQSLSIVKMYGLVLSNHLSMISEYVKLGPLDQYLTNNKKDLKQVDLVEAASNLASALWHLEENGLVHGKIRCRKLFVSRHDMNAFTVKLGDPGVLQSSSSTEVHWIPIECYVNKNSVKHSTAADVWAFATTLWEIFTFAECQLPEDLNSAIKFYRSGKRLSQPHMCPNDIYQVMKECWEQDPYKRKKPQAIMRDINQILYEVFNSRRTHSYSKIALKSSDSFSIPSTSTNSLASNATETTCLRYPGELLSVNSMIEFASDSGSLSDGAPCSEFISDGDDDTFDYRNDLMINVSTLTTSLDSMSSMQSVFELDGDCHVILQGKIGEGHYGQVFKGTLEYRNSGAPERIVAVKKLKTCAGESLDNFNREISIMKMLKHRSIVEIVGVLDENEISLVMEYAAHGSLQSYLKIHKDSLSIKQLLRYALDVAQGMDYLGSKNIVHRDLAARNILVVDENHVKITDFGLAQVMEKNYYILKTNRDLPIKWYAIESLKEHKFSTRSDVWSYGVTLFEMFSYGDEPNLPLNLDKDKVNYQPGLMQQVFLEALEKGIRLPCPPSCPQTIYVRIIYPCWEKEPNRRPTFTQLSTYIEELKNFQT